MGHWDVPHSISSPLKGLSEVKVVQRHRHHNKRYACIPPSFNIQYQALVANAPFTVIVASEENHSLPAHVHRQGKGGWRTDRDYGVDSHG